MSQLRERSYGLLTGPSVVTARNLRRTYRQDVVNDGFLLRGLQFFVCLQFGTF